jgi:hypothetical protein
MFETIVLICDSWTNVNKVSATCLLGFKREALYKNILCPFQVNEGVKKGFSKLR